MKPSPYLVAEALSVQRGTRKVLDEVSVGIHPGDRIGVVGSNGSGKSTLLGALNGEPADAGRLAAASGIRIAMVGQSDELPGSTVRECLVGDRPAHEWASDASVRGILTGLVGGLDAPIFRDGLDTGVDGLSGGESRRIALVRALIQPWDLLLLDEPTNHLDLEAVSWLAAHLNSLPSGRRAFVLVTHDRWLLDEVTRSTWEVTNGKIAEYQGGYAAHILAKNQREEQERAAESKRRNLMRKELAWLRRGAPARTTKAKFRVDAAEELIANEPPPRDSLALHRVATARLGKTVIDVDDMTPFTCMNNRTYCDNLLPASSMEACRVPWPDQRSCNNIWWGTTTVPVKMLIRPGGRVNLIGRSARLQHVDRNSVDPHHLLRIRRIGVEE